MRTPTEESFFSVVDHYDRPYGKVDKTCLVGHAENEEDRIVWVNPEPPARRTEILYHDLPQDEQYFRREEVPYFWTWKYLNDIAETKFKVGKEINYNWWRDENNLSKEQLDYAIREWDRRINGIWMFIDGHPTHITGHHYYYLQHWWLDVKPPDYRDRDLYWFYALQSAINLVFCYGLVVTKHRRAGDTSKAASVGTGKVTQTMGGHFGIQATDEKQANKIFTDKVMPGWKRLVPFFQPMSISGTNPRNEIIMDVQSRKGRAQYSTSDMFGLEAWIKAAPRPAKGSVLFDGDKLHVYFRDEGGKAKDEDILATWDIIKHCLENDGARELAIYTTTIEEIETENAGAYEKLHYDSAFSLMKTNPNRMTTSGMISVFFPAFCGHSAQFIGKFGESIVHKPTKKQLKWLLEKFPEWGVWYENGGAYEYEIAQRQSAKSPADHKRRFPFTAREAFAASNPESDFNIDNLSNCQDELTAPSLTHKNMFDELAVRGRLEWKEDIFKGDVYFIEDSRGPFLWNRQYLPGTELADKLGIKANNIVRTAPREHVPHEKHGFVRPTSVSEILIGADPQKMAKGEAKSKRMSKAAGHGWIPYNPSVDGPWDESVRGFAKDWVTNAGIFQYFQHPKVPRVHHEDMLKACIFLNAKIFYESQIREMGNWFSEIGARAFMLNDSHFRPKTKNPSPGLHSDEEVQNAYIRRLIALTNHHMYARRFPFPETIDQLIKFKIEDIGQLDLVVSLGFVLIANNPREVRRDERKNSYLSPQDAAKKDLYGGLYEQYA